jgi:hypothetical protein
VTSFPHPALRTGQALFLSDTGAELKSSQIVNRRQELRDVQRAILDHGRLQD